MTLSHYFYENIYKKLFGKTWPKWLGGILLAVLNILLFLYIMPIGGIYPAIADWGIWLYKIVGIDIKPPWGTLTLPHLSIISVLNFGLILGVLISALFSRQFKIRKDTTTGYLQGFAGGVLMGIGSFLVGACIIGGFYSSIMSLSLGGFYMMIGLILGGYLGGKIMIWQGYRKAKKLVLDFKSSPQALTIKEYKSNQPKIGFLITIVLIITATIYFLIGKKILGGMMLFGAVFGIAFQRSAFCLTAAFRELFTTKSNEIMRSLLLSLMVGVIGFSIIKSNGLKPANMFVLPAGTHSIIGGFIFGFGMVITGGWAVGILWRSAEGYIRHWFAVLGAMLIAGLWMPVYGHQVTEGNLYGNAIFLPEKIGWEGAMLGTLTVLIAFYIFVTWIEFRKKGGV